MPSQSVKPQELLIESKRVGDVTGDHTVKYESMIDEMIEYWIKYYEKN